MQTDNDVMSGTEHFKPIGGEQGEATGGQEQQTQQTQETQKTTGSPIYLGGRKFETVDELAKYAEDLTYGKTSQQSNAMENANKPKPSQLLYEDPDAFYELAVEEAEKRVMTKLTKKETEKSIWDSFYSKNKDLADYRELVEFQFNKRKNDKAYENLPVEEGLSRIATEVRGFVSKVRGGASGGKELSSAPAMVAGAGNGVAATQVPQKVVAKSFVSQMREFQKRGK